MAIDVTDQDFAQRVVERSHTLPVVVDFWAEWCAPCRQLGPIIEKAAAAREGRVELVKLDTDSNPETARAHRIQGIPAVKAFRDGEVVDEFVGVKPAPAVERFFDALVPSEADELAQTGDEASLRRALELEPGHAGAAVALARILHGRGESEEALELVESLAGSFPAEGLAARIRLEGAPELGLVPAFAALDAGEDERGLDALIEALPGDAHKDDLRRAVVGRLHELGTEHPLAREYRRRLAAALY